MVSLTQVCIFVAGLVGPRLYPLVGRGAVGGECAKVCPIISSHELRPFFVRVEVSLPLYIL